MDEKVGSAGEGLIQGWNEWLQIKHIEATAPSLLSKIEAAANSSSGEESHAVCSPSWKHRGNEIAAAVGVAVRKTVDSLMAPLDEREAAEYFESPVAKQRVAGISIDAPQFLAQQLLGQLEKAAAKVTPIWKNAGVLCASHVCYLTLVMISWRYGACRLIAYRSLGLDRHLSILKNCDHTIFDRGRTFSLLMYHTMQCSYSRHLVSGCTDLRRCYFRSQGWNSR